MKRIQALLLALLMIAGCAMAQAESKPIATYVLPRGAEAVAVWDAVEWDVPAGMEECYALMQNITAASDVYLIRMPNGRALASVSCMTPHQVLSAQELLEYWPQIAMNIANEGLQVNASPSCASIVTQYGHETLQIETTVTLPGGMRLTASGTAFYRDEELLELWAVAPESGYWADAQAEQELADDRADLTAFMRSLAFDANSQTVEGVPCTDPDGRFTLAIPTGCTVLTPYSSDEEIETARQAYLEAHSQDAETLFNEYISDILTHRVMVIISQDQQVVAEIFASQMEPYRDMTAEQLAQLAAPIGESLSERYDAALLLSASEQAELSGHTHSWLGYWLREGEVNVQLDALATVLPDAWLYEIDLYTHNGDQNARSLWFTFFTQTICYTPLSNALAN